MESPIKPCGPSGTEKPLVFDLFCGLGGWSEAFIESGFRAVGFDIEAHDYGTGGYPGELVLRDVRSISGAELVQTYGVPACIVASPPCQEFSYMAMPWSKAKEKMRRILADPAEQKRLTDLFNQCFRIQREVSEAAGCYVPMVIENVRGAQRWVGRARWNFGSYYLWGDVPALMPIIAPRVVLKHGITHRPNGETNFHGYKQNGRNFHYPEKYGIASPSFHGAEHEPSVKRAEGYKSQGMNWSNRELKGQDFTRIAGQQCGIKGVPHKPTGHWTNPEENGIKQGGDWFNQSQSFISRLTSSKSKARKAASAQIAKIPYPLAVWIAKCFRPKPQ